MLLVNPNPNPTSCDPPLPYPPLPSIHDRNVNSAGFERAFEHNEEVRQGRA